MTHHFTQANLLTGSSLRERIPMNVNFTYTWKDPWAVIFTFDIPEGDSVPWIFSRELLNQGLQGHPAFAGTQPAIGQGDITLHLDNGNLILHLASPFGEATFEVPVEPVQKFLEAAYTEVPFGAELDVAGDVFDRELNELIGAQS